MNLAGSEREGTELLTSILTAWLVLAHYAQPPVWALLMLSADIAAHLAAALAAEAPPMGQPQQPHLTTDSCLAQLENANLKHSCETM
jgi:hypothetical protein